MINLPHIYDAYNKPSTTSMIATNNRIKKKLKKADRDQTRMHDKRNSPGVPPNSCPYIDMVLTCLNDMSDAYTRLYERGEHQPKFDDIKQIADDTLEYVRRSNECLRDNSSYWYNKYKQLL